MTSITVSLISFSWTLFPLLFLFLSRWSNSAAPHRWSWQPTLRRTLIQYLSQLLLLTRDWTMLLQWTRRWSSSWSLLRTLRNSTPTLLTGELEPKRRMCHIQLPIAHLSPVHSYCEYSDFQQDDKQCWTGDRIGEYSNTVMPTGLSSQKYNPEVPYNADEFRSKFEVNELGDKLTNLKQSISIAVSPIGHSLVTVVTWICGLLSSCNRWPSTVTAWTWTTTRCSRTWLRDLLRGRMVIKRMISPRLLAPEVDQVREKGRDDGGSILFMVLICTRDVLLFFLTAVMGIPTIPPVGTVDQGNSGSIDVRLGGDGKTSFATSLHTFSCWSVVLFLSSAFLMLHRWTFDKGE